MRNLNTPGNTLHLSSQFGIVETPQTCHLKASMATDIGLATEGTAGK